MRTSFRSSFRRTILLLVAAAGLPILGVLVMTALERSADRSEQNHRLNQRTVQLAAANLGLEIENIHNILLVFSQEGFSGSPGKADLFFDRLHELNTDPRFFSAFVLDRRGNPIWTLRDVNEPVREEFQAHEAGTHAFAVGKVRPTGYGRSIDCYLPVIDDSGKTEGFLAVELGRWFFENYAFSIGLPDEATLFVLDSEGSPVAKTGPEGARDITEADSRVFEGNFSLLKERSDEGFEPVSLEGLQVVGFQGVYFPGIPEAALYTVLVAEKTSTGGYTGLLLALTGVLAGALLAMIVGIFLCKAGYEQSVASLEQAFDRFGSGTMNRALSSEPAMKGEFAQLALEFDSMADALELRERQLEQARKDAETASKNKTEFLANVSHELRTPMNAIQGMGALALKSGLAPREEERMQQILHSGNTLMRIIVDILNISQGERDEISNQATPFRLPDLLENVAGELALRAEYQGVTWSFSLSSKAPEYLLGDALHITQALLLLSGQALDFNAGTNMHISCSVNKMGVHMVLYYSIALLDGIVAEEDMNRIRAALASQAPGTADGDLPSLRLCRDLAASMDGSVNVVNTSRPSTVFSMNLKLSPADSPDPERNQAGASLDG